jgi:hypothetical protein
VIAGARFIAPLFKWVGVPLHFSGIFLNFDENRIMIRAKVWTTLYIHHFHFFLCENGIDRNPKRQHHGWPGKDQPNFATGILQFSIADQFSKKWRPWGDVQVAPNAMSAKSSQIFPSDLRICDLMKFLVFIQLIQNREVQMGAKKAAPSSWPGAALLYNGKT